jgi:hypothetical protein
VEGHDREDDRAAAWAEQNRICAAQWPNITGKSQPPEDAADLLSPKHGAPT